MRIKRAKSEVLKVVASPLSAPIRTTQPRLSDLSAILRVALHLGDRGEKLLLVGVNGHRVDGQRAFEVLDVSPPVRVLPLQGPELEEHIGAPAAHGIQAALKQFNRAETKHNLVLVLQCKKTTTTTHTHKGNLQGILVPTHLTWPFGSHFPADPTKLFD